MCFLTVSKYFLHIAQNISKGKSKKTESADNGNLHLLYVFNVVIFYCKKGRRHKRKKQESKTKGRRKKERKLEKFWVMEMDLSVPVKATTVVIRVCCVATTKQK